MSYRRDDIIAKKYKVVSKIGSGAYGMVYHVRHLVTKKDYAIKTEDKGENKP